MKSMCTLLHTLFSVCSLNSFGFNCGWQAIKILCCASLYVRQKILVTVIWSALFLLQNLFHPWNTVRLKKIISQAVVMSSLSIIIMTERYLEGSIDMALFVKSFVVFQVWPFSAQVFSLQIPRFSRFSQYSCVVIFFVEFSLSPRLLMFLRNTTKQQFCCILGLKYLPQDFS